MSGFRRVSDTASLRADASDVVSAAVVVVTPGRCSGSYVRNAQLARKASRRNIATIRVIDRFMTAPHALGGASAGPAAHDGAARMATVLDHIGNTPLVELTTIGAGLPVPVLAKCEHLNPGGSVKDRIAL